MYAKVMKGEQPGELVQKIGNGNNQYKKQFPTKSDGGHAAVGSIRKLHPNSGGTTGQAGESVSSTGEGHVPEVHKALTDAGFKQAKRTTYANGNVSTSYKHKDGSKARVDENAGTPGSKHNSNPSHYFHVSAGKKPTATKLDYSI